MRPFKHSAQSLFKTIERYLLHHRKYIFSTAINLTTLFIISIALQISGIFEVNKFINLKLFAWTIVAFDIIALRLHQHAKSAIVKDIFRYGFLILFIVQVLKIYITIELLSLLSTYLFILTVIFGVITFWDNRRIINETEKENEQELIEKQKRKKEFAQKYPRINRVWGLRRIVNWMYKEGWWYSGGLLLLITIAFLIRVYNLTILYPYTDEYSHLIAAKSLLETGTTSYTRAYFLSYIIYILFEIFGRSLFIARIPGVIFGALTVVPIYFLVRRVSKPAALISAWLWTISPWAIMVSRNVREYAIFPFFTIFYLIFLIYYVERVLKIIDGRIKYTWKELPLAVGVITPFLYAFIIDPLSSFKQITLVIPPVGLYLLYKIYNNRKNITKNKKIVYTAITLLVSGTILILQKFVVFTRFQPSYNEKWLPFFFRFDIFEKTAWYSLSSSQILLLLCILFGIWYVIQKKNHIGMIIILTCFIELYFLSFHFDRYIRPRYALFVLPVFLSIIGLGIYYLYRLTFNLMSNNFTKKIMCIVITLLLLTLFNPITAYTTITYDKHGYVPMTLEFHDNVEGFIEVYRDKIEPDDIVITSMPDMFRWYFDWPINNPSMYWWNYKGEDRFKKVSEVVSENTEGWIVLDWRRNGRWTKGLPRGDFETGGKKVKFLGGYGSFHVYKWTET